MPWRNKTVEGIRGSFLAELEEGTESLSSLCRKYGISRPTGYKWKHRWETGEGVADRSHAPFHQPMKTAAAVEEQILQFRGEHPGLGAKKIKKILENRGYTMPSASTVNNILKRRGYISKEASQRAERYRRFVMPQPNDLWQADFKGHFCMENGQRCHPLNILDDCSRFCLCSDANEDETYAATKQSFERVFRAYGLPRRLLCDNGNPWGTSQSVGYTRFEVWLLELGVLPIHGRPLHPQTQGKEERFNGTLTRELLKHVSFSDMPHAQRELDLYRTFYNTERPHEALDMRTPAELYRPSPRPMPDRISHWEYEAGQLRRVRDTGFLTYAGQGYFLSEAFAGKTVSVIRMPDDNTLLVCFRQFVIAKIDLNERCIVSRKICKL